MHIHLFKQNSINASKKNLSSLSIFFAVSIILVTVSAMILIPGYGTLLTGTLLMVATLRKLVVSINRKPLLLQITDNEIIYLSEELNELVTINSTEIKGITHRFCELQIQTKDGVIHHVNLLNTGSEQTRWEIKDLIKSLTAKITPGI